MGGGLVRWVGGLARWGGLTKWGWGSGQVGVRGSGWVGGRVWPGRWEEVTF